MLSGQWRKGTLKKLRVRPPRSMVSPSFTAREAKGLFTISFKKVMAVALPTTVAFGVRSSSFSRLPEWSGSVWPTTM